MKKTNQNYSELVKFQKDLYLKLVERCRVSKSVESIIVALETVHHSSLLSKNNDPLPHYISIWKECIKNDMKQLNAIYNCNELNQKKWNELCDESIFTNAISSSCLHRHYRLTNEILNNSFAQINNIDEKLLPTLQKLLHSSSVKK